MLYYHGSSNGKLKKLSLKKSNDGYVYLTPSYEAALMYGACTLRFWDWDRDENKLIIREVSPNSLETMYKGKTTYIYSTEEIGEHEDVNSHGRPAVKMKHDVVLKDCEVVNDSYEKMIQLYQEGKLIIRFWSNYSEEQKQHVIEGVKNSLSKTLDIEREKFPEEYALLQKVCPYLFENA